MGKFVLSSFDRDFPSGRMKNDKVRNAPFERSWLGRVMLAAPFETYQLIDFTGPPGSSMGLYYSLLFQLGKWEYDGVQKADEWIEVSPAHAQYYQITQKQKEELEAKIKASLQSVSQSVADLELLLHDLRKYEEFLHYLGYRTKKEHHAMEKKPVPHPMPADFDEIDFSMDEDEKKRKAREKRVDNHALKAVFIDQVDAHTGDNIAMRSIVSRWPTLISDFMRLEDTDMDPNKVKDRLEVTKAEAIVLVTKNKLFAEWKRMFLPEIRSRYKRILELVRARRRSVEEYKEWTKPYIARHKLMEEGLARPEGRSKFRTLFVTPIGQAYSSTEIEIWAWKNFTSPEIHKVGSEDISRKYGGRLPSVDDPWTMRTLIFNKEDGLVAEYPWITKKWVEQKKKEIYESNWLLKWKPYYSFFVIKLQKTNLRMPSGEELENGMFHVNLIAMSQNALFAKLLELKAKQETFERYVNEMLGIPTHIEGEPYEEKHKDRLEPVKNILDRFSLGFQFLKHGPYESTFDERVTKYYLAPMMAHRFAPIAEFIRAKIGLGTA